MAKSACGPLLMMFLVPLRTKPPFFLSARARRAVASDPASGSDRAKQVVISPATSG
jgi:hypothetical protein